MLFEHRLDGRLQMIEDALAPGRKLRGRIRPAESRSNGAVNGFRDAAKLFPKPQFFLRRESVSGLVPAVASQMSLKEVITIDQLMSEICQQCARHQWRKRGKEWLDLLFAP